VAIEMIDNRVTGLGVQEPLHVERFAPPSTREAGDARRLFRLIESSCRPLAGKMLSRFHDPILSRTGEIECRD